MESHKEVKENIWRSCNEVDRHEMDMVERVDLEDDAVAGQA